MLVPFGSHHQQELSLPEAVDTKRNKILILEDDEEFNSILKQSLEGDYFEVVAVANGDDGIREIVSSDFGAIVCDIVMPKLPGDMFYLAVERLRPQLCSRFVFISGKNGNRKITEFMQRINGTLLKKPFHVDDLLDLIHFVLIRTALASPGLSEP